MSEFLTALFLGFIEGLTEFIPVSSTAHLIVITDILNFQGPPNHIFEVFIQLGAILAVIVLYWKKLFHTAITLPHDKTSQRFASNLLIGCIPAFIVGALARDWIKAHLYNPYVIVVTLILGGIIILLLEKRLMKEGRVKVENVDDIPLLAAFLIGCCQSVALIPGVSRSGATIMGALGLGLARPVAAEFSFFLAIPVMLGAVAYDTYKSWDDIIAHDGLGLMISGFLAAFVTALVVIKLALKIISKYGFSVFAWYRIVAGLVILVIFY